MPPTRPFYVTTPIYYISGTPHIGHAYTTIAADVLARTARAHGPARALTGTDEHGQKVANAAAAAGMTPQQYVDSLAPKWKALAPAFDARFDDFIRTTEPRHAHTCLALFEKMREAGDVYEGVYEGWYCTHDETFWPEAKLIDGRCPNPECRRPVQWLSEKNWFFRLSKYNERLLAHFRANPEFLRPQSRYNEMMAILEEGLEDFSISRSSFDWGIPLPGGGVLYVWYDALINYISALGWPEDPDGLFRTFWPGMHLIGKEIARFHSIIWPAMLWSAGLPEPARVFAHGWITNEGEKMSKSAGQRDRAVRADRGVRRRRGAVFLVARSAVRQRLLDLGREAAHAQQQRSWATTSATCCGGRSRCCRSTATGWFPSRRAGACRSASPICPRW